MYLLSELYLIIQVANDDINSIGISIDPLGRPLIPSNYFNLMSLITNYSLSLMIQTHFTWSTCPAHISPIWLLWETVSFHCKRYSGQTWFAFNKSALTVPSYFLILLVSGNGFQYVLTSAWREGDQPVAPQIPLLLALPDNRHEVCFPPANSQSPWPSHHPCSDIGQLPQQPWIHPLCFQALVYVQYSPSRYHCEDSR